MKIIVKNVPNEMIGFVECALEGLHYADVETQGRTVTAITPKSQNSQDCWELIEPELRGKNLEYTVIP